jgi:hypothetical protein
LVFSGFFSVQRTKYTEEDLLVCQAKMLKPCSGAGMNSDNFIGIDKKQVEWVFFPIQPAFCHSSPLSRRHFN